MKILSINTAEEQPGAIQTAIEIKSSNQDGLTKAMAGLLIGQQAQIELLLQMVKTMYASQQQVPMEQLDEILRQRIAGSVSSGAESLNKIIASLETKPEDQI